MLQTMINKFSICSIQVSFLLLETTSNLIPPQYSIKVLNTENVILSLGDVDDDTNYDLELIKKHPENSLLEKKLYEFHKYINLAEKTERPKDRRFQPCNRQGSRTQQLGIQYPDSPYQIAADEKHLSMWERRKEERKKLKRHKRRRKKKLRVKRMDEEENKNDEEDDTEILEDVGEAEAEYDYMQKAYFDYLANTKKNNIYYKYSDEGKPEETIKDVLLKIIDVRTPQNCTEVRGIGIQALECIIRNYQDGYLDRKTMIHSIGLIILIWICIYLAIVLPLWCCKGWCCCCCGCAFCYPSKTVREIQKYVLQNPPGVIRHSDGQEEHYTPTHRENEMYERIKRSIAEFGLQNPPV